MFGKFRALCQKTRGFGTDFEYEQDMPVLRGAAFEARPGTATALVGRSGAGKSTPISLVAALAKPTRGTILVDGVDLAAVRLDSIDRSSGSGETEPEPGNQPAGKQEQELTALRLLRNNP